MCIVRHQTDAALGRISCCASQAREATCNAGYGERRSAGLRATDGAGRGLPRLPRLARALRGDGSARTLPPGPTRTAPRTNRAPATLDRPATRLTAAGPRVAGSAAFFLRRPGMGRLLGRGVGKAFPQRRSRPSASKARPEQCQRGKLLPAGEIDVAGERDERVDGKRDRAEAACGCCPASARGAGAGRRKIAAQPVPDLSRSVPIEAAAAGPPRPLARSGPAR
jgi:hypothetical protein